MREHPERRARSGAPLHVRRVLGAVAAGAALSVPTLSLAAGASADSGARDATTPPREFAPPVAGTYTPPIDAPVTDPFRMDHGPYGPGNRGLEYGSRPGQEVRSIGSGTIVFAGPVAGRLAVTVLHPDGRRSSLTGLVSLSVRTGDVVRRGSPLGTAGEGLHLGVREGERYVDPAGLFAAVRRRAVLVPLGATTPD